MGHLAHFVRDMVRDSLDLSAILKTCTEDRGFPPQQPRHDDSAVLLYAYCQGHYASRCIVQKTCEDRVDFIAVICPDRRPDFRTVSDVRKRHLTGVKKGSRKCSGSPPTKVGLVTLWHFALGGTKLKAIASKHKGGMSYGRMQKAEADLAATARGGSRRRRSSMPKKMWSGAENVVGMTCRCGSRTSSTGWRHSAGEGRLGT